MNWIVLYEKAGNIILTSKRGENTGLLPKGSYITIDMTIGVDDDEKRKELADQRFVLRVEESEQTAVYSPSPLLADMDLSLQEADRECKNQITARRIYDFSQREDGLVDYVKPQSLARLSNEEEIKKATSSEKNNGPHIFPATVYSSKSQKLKDLDGKSVKLRIPVDIFWHQMQITGKTGSGKTVATKYLAQHFIENKITEENINKYGCVLAINVKDEDFLKMNQPTVQNISEVNEEWNTLGMSAKGVKNFEVLYSAHEPVQELKNRGVDATCKPITLNASRIEPEALLGVVEGLTELASQALPDIFRYWQSKFPKKGYDSFLDHFDNCIENDYEFPLMDITNKVYTQKQHTSSANAMRARLKKAAVFFDNPNGTSISAKDILQEGKMTVINVASSLDFGTIVLRYLLTDIVKEKFDNDTPILIIIDEVHEFYKSNASKSALGELDTICRKGRSKKMGVIFSSQNSDDLPKGLASVVNTKFMFKTDEFGKKINGVYPDDIAAMKAGYCLSKIHGMPQLKLAKFPLSTAGVQI